MNLSERFPLVFAGSRPGPHGLRSFALAALICFLLIPAAFAQTTWSVEGSNPSYGEYNAADPLCLPGGLPYAIFLPPVPPPGCPPMGSFPPGECRIGGTAFDDDGNVVSGGTAFPAMLHSDGKIVEMTDPATGAFILDMCVGGFVVPGTVSGLGYDSANDICWVTDGLYCAGVSLANCAIPPTVVGPFMLPLVGGAPASGLDWDPCTGTLWFCDCAGHVVNCDTAGTLISFFSTQLPGGIEFTGLDVNVTNGNIQLTEGATVGEFTPAGPLAAPGAFYLKSNPYALPIWADKVNGLGFSLRPQKDGEACPPGGPSIGYSGGYPFAGNAGFNIFQTGATPGAQAYIIYGTQEACPALPIGGCPGGGVWIFPFTLLSLGAVPAAGTVNLPVNIPPSGGGCGFPVGVPLRVQFINVISLSPLVLEVSDALSFTIGGV